MKRTLFYIQSIICALSFVSLLVIAIFPDKIREGFRTVINQDLAHRLEKPVGLAEKALKVPGIEQIVSADKLRTVQEEITLYRVDPLEYVASLTGNTDASKDRLEETMKTANPAQKAVLEKIIGWREKIKTHFFIAFDGITTYLIGFLATNTVALLFAMYLIRWARTDIPDLTSTSVILTTVVALSSLLFIDRSWFYAIIRSDFNLYTYPSGLLMTFFYVMYKYHEYRR
jgi:hypothetical protein